MSSDSPQVEVGWNADLLRLTAFPTPRYQTPPVESWWKEVIGEPPDKIITEPKKGEVQLQGTFSNIRLTMTSQVMRVELRQEVNLPDQPPIGPYDDARSAFCQLAQKWLRLENYPPLQRLAFGAILTKLVGVRKEDGYKTLGQYLPGVEIPQNSSDFLYQINRPRPSNAVNDLAINRLSKWSVQQFRQVSFGSVGAVVMSQGEFSCRVELDINSDPEHTSELPTDRLPALFDELVTLADELSIEGDIP